MNNKFIISCEHASNNIPAEWGHLFASLDAKKDLNTHLGIDIGAKKIAEYFSDELSCDLFLADYSRLLIELNRSLDNPKLFSKYTQNISDTNKQDIIKDFYNPYRIQVENLIKKYINQNNKVFHFSIHSFTPVLNDKVRTTDIGLLYDPNKIQEKEFCKELKKIYLKDNRYKLKLNYPYRGTSDGFTTYLRAKFDASKYLGVEIEFNQKYFINNKFDETLAQSVTSTLKSFFTHKVLTLG